MAAALAALGAAVLWGTTGTAQALGPTGTDPTSVGATRILLGAAVLLLLAWQEERRGTRSPAAEGPSQPPQVPTVALLVIGGLGVAAYQVCFFLGVARAGVAIGTVVALGIAPLATGLLGLLLGERPGRRWVLATAGAVVGIVLLVAGAGSGGDGTSSVGILAALGAGVSYAVFTVAARTLIVRGVSGLRVMAAFFGIGAALLATTLPGAELGWLASPRGVLMVLWLGVVATALAYVLFQRGLAGLPAGTVATLSLAEPVTATLLGVLVLREHLSALTALGIGVVVVSLLLMTLRGRSRPVLSERV